jgi:fumarylacetoacetate (FAA) hydrolase
MKFSTLKTNHPDGALCLVSSDLSTCFKLDKLAPHLQYAIENWDELKSEFESLYSKLNRHELHNTFPYEADKLHSPLPRAYQWADGSAYLHHVQLVRKARGAEMPPEFLTDPLMYQGGSDMFLPPTAPIEVASETYGIDFESEIAVITKTVAMGSDAKTCESKIILLMLVNDVSLRNLIPNELGKGFGFFHSKPSSSFSPLAITPDELGHAWDGKRLHLPLLSYYNGKIFGQPNAGIGMQFSFPELIAHAAKTRTLGPGSIIGSGTVSNDIEGVGSSCIAEKRSIETIETGQPITPFMHFGDTIKIEMRNQEGLSLFGAIEQKVKPYYAQ